MNENEINDAINRYNKRLEEHGVSEKALGWGEKGRAKLRYEILLSQWCFNDSSVLDFGCGFGGMYDYMMSQKINNFQYTGIDINEKFIDIAKNSHKKEENANFFVANLLCDKSDEKFDFILSSGVFNHKLENNKHFIESCFEKFNEYSNKGFAVNFLSDKVAYKYEYTFHSDPAYILELAYKYSNNIVLRNDYMPFEFTVFINKYSQIDPVNTVYNEYLKYV